MATNRSRRLRKKLCVDEFQELGCELQLQYRDGADESERDAFILALHNEVLIPQGLLLIGCNEFGLVCLMKRGSVSTEQRAAVEQWLSSRSDLASFSLSALQDAWYPGNPLNAA